MKHKEYEEYIQLYLMDELEDDKKILLLNHLKECKECTANLQENNNIISLFNTKKQTVPSDMLLNTARIELKTRIKIEQSKKTYAEVIRESFHSIFISNYKITISYALTLLIGLVVGFNLFRPQIIIKTIKEYAKVEVPVKVLQNQKEQTKLETKLPINKSNSSNSFADKNSNLAVDSAKADFAISENTDEKMKNLFTYTLLNSQNAGQRLNTINMIGSNFNELDKEVESAIISAVKNDENPGVRKQALDLLKRYKYDYDIKNALFFVLKNDSVPGLRITAMLMLADESRSGERFNDSELNVLKETTVKDENSYVRMQALAVLKEYK